MHKNLGSWFFSCILSYNTSYLPPNTATAKVGGFILIWIKGNVRRYIRADTKPNRETFLPFRGMFSFVINLI